MGPPFVSVNTWTRRVEFLWMEKSITHAFEECWATYTEMSRKRKLDGAKPEETKVATEEITPPPKAPKTVATPKKSPVKKARSEEQLHLSAADKARTKYHLVTSKAEQVLKDIKSDPSWEWARGNMDTQLLSALALAREDISDVQKSFLLSEASSKEWLKDSVQTFGKTEVANELSKMSLVMKKIDDVGAFCKKLHNMQSAFKR